MKTKKLLFYLLAALLGGCVPVMSLHSLYTEEDVVFERKLLGTWVQDTNETTWEFKCPNEPKKTYELIFSDNNGKKGSFDAHLTKLENKLFLDVYPNKYPSKQQNPEDMQWFYNVFFAVGVHTFIKIDSIEPQLRMRLTDDNEMKKLLEEDPNAVKHTWLEDDKFILTASTKELQAFVLKYADDKRLFPGEMVLRPKDTPELQEPGKQNPNKHSEKK